MSNTFIDKVKRVYATAHELVAERGLDRHHEGAYPRLHQFAHFWVLVVKSFLRNRCMLRATALSYSTLLALVPLLAIGASITSSVMKERGSEATQELIEQFIRTVAPQLDLFSRAEVDFDLGSRTAAASTTVAAPPVDSSATHAAASGNPPEKISAPKAVVDQINVAIENFHSKTIGVTGLIGFIAVAILLLATIEDTFNDIWGVTTGRAWFRRLVQYWTAISLGPIVIVVAFLLTKSRGFESVQLFLADKPVFSFFLSLVPYVTISLAFGLFYKLMPNTQVHWRAAFAAGFVGGSLWWLNNEFSAANLGRVINMSKLYGPLAIIPIFLIGLYLSWFIMLFGAQVAYALQNRKIYLQEKKTEGISQRSREFISLRVMLSIAQRFQLQTRPPTVLEISDQLGVPSRLVGRLLQPLLAAGLVVEVALPDDVAAYAPGRPLETITCHDVIQALRAGSDVHKEPQTQSEPAREVLRHHFNRIEQAEQKIAVTANFRDLVEEIAPQPVLLTDKPED